MDHFCIKEIKFVIRGRSRSWRIDKKFIFIISFSFYSQADDECKNYGNYLADIALNHLTHFINYSQNNHTPIEAGSQIRFLHVFA